MKIRSHMSTPRNNRLDVPTVNDSRAQAFLGKLSPAVNVNPVFTMPNMPYPITRSPYNPISPIGRQMTSWSSLKRGHSQPWTEYHTNLVWHVNSRAAIALVPASNLKTGLVGVSYGLKGTELGKLH